jgi:tRNA nucleotidyltransferase (CCA-adding enzyme)
VPVEKTTIAAELRAIARLQPVFDAIGPEREYVFLVGGTVRDILLGRDNFDVDLAVEGTAMALGTRLAHELRGQALLHDRFGTAIVRYGHGEHVDVVTTRREIYTKPAALPTVEFGTIEDDLRRRDFTINAIAASLAPDDFGKLIDPFGGGADLEEGTIRILHEQSFVDDPTRIFRAIRYESRLGFRMDPDTERLARTSIEAGLVRRLSGARLREELVALLDEADVGHTFRRLRELGADRAIGLTADDEAERLALQVDELRAELDVEIPAWRIRLGLLARGVPPRLDELGLRRRDVDRIEGALRVAERLTAAVDPVEIDELAAPNAPDAPLLALALADRPELREWFTRLRSVRLEIGGDDLAALGLAESPRVGEVLQELRRRKLRGELDGRDAELAAARELIDA